MPNCLSTTYIRTTPSLATNMISFARLTAAVFTIVTFAAFCTPACANQRVDYRPDQEIIAKQWEAIDICFTANTNSAHQVDDDFQATATHTDGTKLSIHGFFNGKKEYLLRFTPPKSGKWTFETKSPSKELNGKNGSLTVSPAATNRKGGVVIDSTNPRQFQYENGESCYPIAFESDWLFALDAENPSDIPSTRKFVDTLADNGFNQIVLNVFAYDVNWAKDEKLTNEFDYGSPNVFPFGGTNQSPDHDKLNVEYFQRFDRVVEYLDEKGITAHLMIYVWNKNVNWPPANSPADNRYFDYVVKRYQAYPNIVWNISKEALGYGHTDVNYITKRIERLRSLDTYKRLVTVHDYGYCRRFPQEVDFISVQLWGSELYSVMRDVRKTFPDQPILNIEHGGYESSPFVVFTGDYTSAEVCLERAYKCVFAGTYPTHYWQGAAWNVIIPDINAMPKKDRPHLEYYRHMRSLIEKYDVGNLVAGDKRSSSGHCLHNNDNVFIFYVPKENIRLGVRKFPKKYDGASMTGTWFDPFTGKYSEPVEKKNVNWPFFTKPPGDKFAILIVEFRGAKTNDRK